jgi:hypothetical protein
MSSFLLVQGVREIASGIQLDQSNLARVSNLKIASRFTIVHLFIHTAFCCLLAVGIKRDQFRTFAFIAGTN